MAPSVPRYNSEIVADAEQQAWMRSNRLRNAAMTYDLYFSLTTTPKNGQEDRRCREYLGSAEEKEGQEADETC
jgi:hypothetical protein